MAKNVFDSSNRDERKGVHAENLPGSNFKKIADAAKQKAVAKRMADRGVPDAGKNGPKKLEANRRNEENFFLKKSKGK